MTRPQDMGPADLAPNTVPPETLTPEQARKVERNAFYNSLPLAEKEAFLASLEDSARVGLDEESAWLAAMRVIGVAGDEDRPESDENL